ncbi:MAG: hypothetical protein JM58_14625 [Peptococcaceae bacterium BICA1-8]|nr:MAG: hypothetical protein JM58_14625 [Peptococcaceae bacterium BICA1-8]
MLFILDTKKCTGCRICELVCSFHHSGTFAPSLSSIQVSRKKITGEIKLAFYNTTKDAHPACNCTLNQEKCIEYCPVEGREELTDILRLRENNNQIL